MPEFPVITHVALTVTSLERSVPSYEDLFGSEPLINERTPGRSITSSGFSEGHWSVFTNFQT